MQTENGVDNEGITAVKATSGSRRRRQLTTTATNALEQGEEENEVPDDVVGDGIQEAFNQFDQEDIPIFIEDGNEEEIVEEEIIPQPLTDEPEGPET